MIGVFIGKHRIGTVAKFLGNSSAERWVAWSMVRQAGAENRCGFPRRKDAIAWLEQQWAERAAA